jgi:hypothetical protein
MNVPPHIEYLQKIVGDPDESSPRRHRARQILMFETWMESRGGCLPSRDPNVARLEGRYDFPDSPTAPRYALPRPAVAQLAS